jgi:hypothetical protein
VRKALNWVFGVLVSGYDGDQVILNDKSRTPSYAEGLGRVLLLNSYPVYMVFILVNFILSIIQTQYRETHRVSRDRILRGGRTTAHDIEDAVKWAYKWAASTCARREEVSPSRLSHNDILMALSNRSLSRQELESLEKMKRIKDKFASGIQTLLKPAIESAEEREKRCRGMRITLGGVVHNFDQVLLIFDKNQVSNPKP